VASVRSCHRLLSALDTKRSSDVTMYQRSSTYVMSVTDGVRLVFGGSLRNFYEVCMVTENLLDQVFIMKVVHQRTSLIV